MSVEEMKRQIRDNIKWDTKRPAVTGGQHCGMPYYPIILISKELDFEVTVGFHRSQIKNMELAQTLFELALDELVK
jgi:hypothetical protein